MGNEYRSNYGFWDLILVGVGLAGLAYAGFLGYDFYNYLQDLLSQRRLQQPTAELTPTQGEIIFETPVPQRAVETVIPLLTSTIPAELQSGKTKPGKCIKIDKSHQNAYQAWLQLNKPGAVIFENLAGPDKIKDDPGTVRMADNLPGIVHYGDKICDIGGRGFIPGQMNRGFSPARSSLPAMASYGGFGVRK